MSAAGGFRGWLRRAGYLTLTKGPIPLLGVGGTALGGMVGGPLGGYLGGVVGTTLGAQLTRWLDSRRDQLPLGDC